MFQITPIEGRLVPIEGHGFPVAFLLPAGVKISAITPYYKKREMQGDVIIQAVYAASPSKKEAK